MKQGAPENMEDLIGPRSHERGEFTPDEFHSKDGEPLWMALLDEEETLTLAPHQVQEAKNKLMELIATHKEEVEMCTNKTMDECREILHPFLAEAA